MHIVICYTSVETFQNSKYQWQHRIHIGYFTPVNEDRVTSLHGVTRFIHHLIYFELLIMKSTLRTQGFWPWIEKCTASRANWRSSKITSGWCPTCFFLYNLFWYIFLYEIYFDILTLDLVCFEQCFPYMSLSQCGGASLSIRRH